jgi:HSP20 family protein
MFGLVRPSGFDSWEENDLLFLRLEVPGYDKENISVAAENGTIVIEAAREQPKREYLVRSTVDKFRKVINVPPMWSLDKIDASYVNGVLVMTVEKDKKKTKKVQIK